MTVLTTQDELTDALSDGDRGTIIVDETPFYATMGGQEGDTGVIVTPEGEFAVEATVKLKGDKIGHVGVMIKGMMKIGDLVTLRVEETGRNNTCKNHSATHLLQKALRMVLGTHVEQQGSLVTPNRLRFDFTHFQSMTAEEIAKVEAIVNEEIAKNLPVVTQVMNIEEAKKSGAMALFGEKYGDTVRVVSMGEFSKEFCGGTHVANTGAISLFKIVSEAGIAAGVRRIEALTGDGVLAYFKNMEEELHAAAKAAKSDVAGLIKKIESMQAEIKSLSSENESLKSRLANNAAGDVLSKVKEIGGMKFLGTTMADVDMNALRNLGDSFKEKLGECVIVLASGQGTDKVNLIAMATDGAVKKGAHAGNIIKEAAQLVGGGGGGRPNMAQAGGKNPAGMEAALKKAEEVLASQLG